MKTRPEQETQQIIEAQLRASAPALPPELRSRVLRRCEQARRNKPMLLWWGQWRLAGALAGCIVLFCGIGSACLDAQSQAMISGSVARPSANLPMSRADSIAQTQADSRNFGIALRWRIRQLALLLHEKHSG